MKVAKYRKIISQKGFSPIIIILVLVIAGFGILALSKSKNQEKSPIDNNNRPVTKEQPSVTSLMTKYLDKIEELDYTFYYPKDYVKTQSPAKNVPVYYQNSKTTAAFPEFISLEVLSNNKLLEQPTYQTCVAIAEGTRKKGDDEIKVEVAKGLSGLGKGDGCKTITKSKVKGTSDYTVVYDKALYYTEGTNYNFYHVRAAHFASAPQDVISKLESAIDNFTLK
ncbi:MAG: hypothetical protein Q7R43_00615 [Candidatus Daviesbacteria bacterium]|nr:hypothetical protein [Candidatus Daviesbacteria bacterium]